MATTQPPDQQVRAGCYCRISSDPNDKRHGVDRQRDDTTALCEVKGWTPVGFYEDNNRSASNGKGRPEWDRLLADIKAGKVDAIAAWDQDRNWRVMSELETLRKFFTGLGRQVPLATTGQGDIDLYSPTGVMMAQIKTAVSEHEIAMMKVRQRRAHRQKAERGKPQWKRAFGYLPDTRRKEEDDGIRQVDPKTAPLVEKAYTALLTGHSLNDIARLLNDAGAQGERWVRPKDKHGEKIDGSKPQLVHTPWSATTVSLFLRNPRNAGLRAHTTVGEDGKPVTEILGKGTWPGLVKKSTWDAAQTLLDAPSRKPGRKTVRRHLLTGALQCGKPGCGGHLSGCWSKTQRLMYRCQKCFGVAIAAEWVEPHLEDVVSMRLARKDARNLLKKQVHNTAEAAAIRKELSELYAEKKKIGIERGLKWIDGEQARDANAVIQPKIDRFERSQQDHERLAVLKGLPLGTPAVVGAIAALAVEYPDRYRAVVDLLMTATVMPVGKGGHVFNPQRVVCEPKV